MVSRETYLDLVIYLLVIVWYIIVISGFFNPCHANTLLLYLLKTSENQSYVRLNIMCLSCLRDITLHVSAIYTAIAMVILEGSQS